MKGDNLRIETLKQDLTAFINRKLQELPIGVIKMALESSLIEVNNLYVKIVEQEASKYEEECTNNQNGTEDDKED